MPKYKMSATQPVSSINFADHVMTGAIRIEPTEGIPTGWLPCDGSFRLISDYPQLYKYLTTKNGITITNPWGSDNGVYFMLPDSRGLMLKGWDNGAGRETGSRSTPLHTGSATGDHVGSYQTLNGAAGSATIDSNINVNFIIKY